MRKVLIVFVIILMVFALSFITIGPIFTGQRAQMAECERTLAAVNKNDGVRHLTEWFDSGESHWLVADQREPPTIPLGQGEFRVPPPENMQRFGLGPKAEAQAVTSKGKIVAAQLVDSDGRVVVVAKIPDRWYAWNAKNLLTASSRVAVNCPTRD